MELIKKFILKHFENFFVISILVVTASINYVIDQKLAYLNFYFLPIVLSGYYLGARKSVIGAIFAILIVVYFVIESPQTFSNGHGTFSVYMHVTVWGSFLLLVATVVGKQHENLTNSLKSMEHLNKSLQTKQDEVNVANQRLVDYSMNLEKMVHTRTEELESSKQTLETLKGKVEATLYATMDAAVARLMIEGRLRNDKRAVSILFADLQGFTTYAEERSPELVVRDINRYLSEMEPIIHAFHGHLDKFLGDGIMCEFGAPLDYANYRLLAVLTGLKMQQKMNSLGLPWKMRIGAASGSAITGLIGARRQSYTSIGDVVNVASRLESNCPIGEFIIDEFTYEGCSRFIEAQIYHLDSQAESDEAVREELGKISNEITYCKDDERLASLYSKKSQLETTLGELELAFASIEKSVNLQPANSNYRLALADLMIARKTENNLKLKGRKKSVKAYRVVGIKNNLLDIDRFPPSLFHSYGNALSSVSIPEDFALRVEALDGTIGHSKAVALLSYAIASKLDLYEKEKSEILIAGFAADFGKEIVPHHLLNRPGTLSDSEWLEVRKHPSESVSILRSLGYESESLLKIVEHSHEKLDGSGYPDGLKGDEIPLGSKIIAVADIYDALTSWRPYREKWDKEASLDEISQMAKRGLLDETVVATLIEIIMPELIQQRKLTA